MKKEDLDVRKRGLVRVLKERHTSRAGKHSPVYHNTREGRLSSACNVMTMHIQKRYKRGFWTCPDGGSEGLRPPFPIPLPTLLNAHQDSKRWGKIEKKYTPSGYLRLARVGCANAQNEQISRNEQMRQLRNARGARETRGAGKMVASGGRPRREGRGVKS